MRRPFYLVNGISAILNGYLELRAGLSGRGFYCKALKGESNHNICINSDLTVTCNCNDIYGSAKIGDIGSSDLKDIFSGEKANRIRTSLANGRLPLPNCAGCPDLCSVDKAAAAGYIHDYNLPKRIMIENTADCGLRCLSCQREEIYKNRKKTSMSLDDVERVAKSLKQNGIRDISYFNLGEPFHSKNIRQELEMIRRHNPGIFISTSTNGMFSDSTDNMEAALLFDLIYFSIDGSTQGSVRKYQRGADFDRSYSNMRKLAALRGSRNKKTPVIEWKYVLFRWNDDRLLISKAIELAVKADADFISFWPTLSPLRGISYRYYLGLGGLRKIGRASWKGREIDLRSDKYNKTFFTLY